MSDELERLRTERNDQWDKRREAERRADEAERGREEAVQAGMVAARTITDLNRDLNDAKRDLAQHKAEREQLGPALVIAQQIHRKGVTPEVIAGYEMIQTAVTTLVLNADHAIGIKNYVEFQLAGLRVPFDRAAVHLVRPGGKTPHELRQEAERQFNCAVVLLAGIVGFIEDHNPLSVDELREKLEWLRAGCP